MDTIQEIVRRAPMNHGECLFQDKETAFIKYTLNGLPNYVWFLSTNHNYVEAEYSNNGLITVARVFKGKPGVVTFYDRDSSPMTFEKIFSTFTEDDFHKIEESRLDLICEEDSQKKIVKSAVLDFMSFQTEAVKYLKPLKLWMDEFCIQYKK